jgi:hypothetical protein
VAQSGSAFGWGPKGRRFKSGRPDCHRVGFRTRFAGYCRRRWRLTKQPLVPVLVPKGSGMPDRALEEAWLKACADAGYRSLRDVVLYVIPGLASPACRRQFGI